MIFSERYCASCGAANQGEAETCFACGLSLKITLPLPEITSGGRQRLLKERFRILAQVGRGGFSAVYRAEDTAYNDHLVAIKAISLSGLTPKEIIEATDAFNREVALLTHLKHPGLPRIYSNFADAECWYMVMDFIEGVTLERCLEQAPQGRLSVGEALNIGQSLCAVLEYLHSRQPTIIFRDLKPGNIIIRTDGHLTLIDFGIARHYKAGQARDTIPFGSPGYAAPEQYGRAQTTPRSDIYSLGAILHQLLSGDDPALTPFHFVSLHTCLGDQPALTELDTLIAAMVSVDARQRPASVSMVKQQLERISHNWFTQQKQGLRARVLPPGQVYSPSYRQPPAPAYFAAGGTGQGQIMIQRSSPGVVAPLVTRTTVRRGMIIQRSSAGRGGSAGHAGASPYWSAPSSTKQGQGLAIASLVISLLSIFTVPATFIGSFILTNWIGQSGYNAYPWALLPLLIVMSLPSILGVVLGFRARGITVSQSVKDMAAAGIAIGVIIGLLYAGVICTIVSLWFTFR